MSAGVSSPWTLRSNRAEQSEGTETSDFDSVPLLESDEISIYNSDRLLFPATTDREDGVGNAEAVEEWRSVRTGTAIERFTEWAEDSVSPVVTDGETYKAVGDPHRFAPRYRKKQYARLMNLARGIGDEYGNLLHTAMLSLTASNSPAGELVSPVDHLSELLESWEAVRRELSRQLEDYEWEYIGILEPHKSGYAHMHIGVFVKGVVSESTFRPVIEAHLRNCRWAGESAHEDAVTVHATGVSREFDAEDLGAYLAAYMGESFVEDDGEGLDSAEFSAEGIPRNVLRFWTTLWASGAQQFRPSNGAQSYMRGDYEAPEPSEPWWLCGIIDGVRNGEVEPDSFTECEAGGSRKRRKQSIGRLNREAMDRWRTRCERRRGNPNRSDTDSIARYQ